MLPQYSLYFFCFIPEHITNFTAVIERDSEYLCIDNVSSNGFQMPVKIMADLWTQAFECACRHDCNFFTLLSTLKIKTTMKRKKEEQEHLHASTISFIFGPTFSISRSNCRKWFVNKS